MTDPSDPAVDRYLLLTGAALHVAAHPGDGRAAVVLLDVGVVLIGGEVCGGVREVGGEPAGMAQRGCGVLTAVP
jgi:hypothetical protein